MAIKPTDIEYGDLAYNPITGCQRGCPYCFARTIATRFGGHDGEQEPERPVIRLTEPLKLTRKGRIIQAPYPYGFRPTFYEYRLNDPADLKKARTVLVCFSGDMFGPWIPDSWIESVFLSLESRPGRFLFLTKYPQRYTDLARAGKLPEEDSFWYGTTVTGPGDAFFQAESVHTWLSVEPVLEPLGPSFPDGDRSVDWAVFGAETGRRMLKVYPADSWIRPAVERLQGAGVPVYMKKSLDGVWDGPLVRELPWTTQTLNV